MPIVELPILWVVLFDALAWTFFHLAISFATVQIPRDWFVRKASLFSIHSFEQHGLLWQRLFRVKQWKQLIPDGTLIIRNGYNKRTLHGIDSPSLKEFIVESRRAEFTHWLSILPAALFFLWNPIWAAWANVGYAVLFNGPIIIAQRYNRPRLERLVKRKHRKPLA